MRLKALTTFMILLGIVLLGCWPFVLKMRPHRADGSVPAVRVRRLYLVTLGGYVGATLFSFMTAGALAAVMIRQAREQFQHQAVENMRDLVEGSLDDLRAKGRQA